MASGLHHGLCHALGGAFGAPHVEAHVVLLVHSVAYNARAVPENPQVAYTLGVSDAAIGICELAIQIGVPMSLHRIARGRRKWQPHVPSRIPNE